MGRFIGQKTFFCLMLVLLAGGILRFWGLGDRTLWIDEGYGVFYSNQSWTYLWQTVPEYEIHLPLFYSVLKLWRAVAGSSEAALRTPAVLASLGVVLCLFMAGRITGGRRNGVMLGLMAAALFAVWKLQIELARDARPYAFCALGMSLTMIGTLHILSFPARYRDWPWNVVSTRLSSALALLSLVLGMALMLWSHNVGAIAVLANSVYIIFWWAFSQRCDIRLLATLGGCGLLLIILFAPGIPLILAQAGGMPDQYWQSEPSILGLLSISTKGVVQPLPLLGFGTELSTILALLVALPLFFFGVVGYFRVTNSSLGIRMLSIFFYPLFLCISIWLALVVLTYTYLPLILPRTLVFIVPPALLILSAFPFTFREEWRNVAVAFLLGLSALGTINLVRTTERPFAPIVQHISESDAPDAPVLILPNSVALPMQYYNERWNAELDFRSLPEPFPARSEDYVYVTGNKAAAAVDKNRLSATVSAIEDHETIWTVTRFQHLYDPDSLLEEHLSATGRCPQFAYGLDRTANLVRWSTGLCEDQAE